MSKSYKYSRFENDFDDEVDFKRGNSKRRDKDHRQRRDAAKAKRTAFFEGMVTSDFGSQIEDFAY